MTVTTTALDEFCGALKTMRDAYDARCGYKFLSEFSYEIGKKYARIVVSSTGSRSAFCFVDLSNGDILKAAGWKVPAKTARGNIRNGAADVGPYGPAYLRG